MSEKLDSNIKLTPEELAKHLKQPQGETGKEVGLQMNKGNKYICLNSYKLLKPKNGDCILEIGMGNGFYIKDLLALAGNKLQYTGVDFSTVMIEEASKLNKDFIDAGLVNFFQASIAQLPFDNDTFDYITTTNTIYFWPRPTDNAEELLRVLKPGGKLLVAYRPKYFMDRIEVANYGFTKYDIPKVEDLLNQSGFKTVTSQIIKEPKLEFDGKVLEMEGVYTFGGKA